jgi:peptide/nickel transport system substrate-binding protein
MYAKLTIPERLKDLRVVDKHLTLEQLAEQTGLSKSALGKYETDDYKDISPFAIATLADFYGVSTDYLMGLTENKNHPNTELQSLHLSDDMVELLSSGKINNRLLCELATHPNFRRLMIDMEIIEAAKWGDGKPVICQDFITSHKIATAPTVTVGEKEQWTQVEKIDIDPKNPKKCTFKYDRAIWSFYQLAQFFPLPTHLEMPVFEKHGKAKEGYEKNSNYVRNPNNPGLYNGPYVITDVKLGSHIAFAPNKFFYGKQPNIQKIVVKLIPNTGTMEANLRSGTIDMISVLGLDFDQALAFEKKAKAESLPFNVHFVPSVTYEHIDLNLDNPILKDERVRKALLYSINRDDLVKALFEGRQEVALHNFSPKDTWFTKDPKAVTLYSYSKRTAGKLLDEAGWKMGADGFRAKDGKRLSLIFQTTAGNKTRELVQVYLQNQWKQNGIEVLVKNEPARVFFSDTMTKRKFGGLAMFAWVSLLFWFIKNQINI